MLLFVHRAFERDLTILVRQHHQTCAISRAANCDGKHLEVTYASLQAIEMNREASRHFGSAGARIALGQRGGTSILPALWPASVMRWPMILSALRSNAMDYRAHEISYESDEMRELGSEFIHETAAGKQYRQRRSASPQRRRTPKSSHPGCGMAGRRNKRWAW